MSGFWGCLFGVSDQKENVPHSGVRGLFSACCRGSALQTLGQRDNDTQRLETAVAAYHAALEERTQEHVPLDWAGTQENLAIVMLASANHPTTTEPRSSVEAAFEYVNAALEVYDETQSPFDHETATRSGPLFLDSDLSASRYYAALPCCSSPFHHSAFSVSMPAD